MECDVIRDLIPLYKEDLLSDASNKLVENHLKTCNDCMNYYKEINNEGNESELKENKPLDFLSTSIKKDKNSLSLMLISLLVSIFIIVLSFMTKPIPIDYNDNLVKVKSDSDNINIKFDDKITRIDTNKSTIDGHNIIYIDAYTCYLDKILKGKHISLKLSKTDTDIVAYTNNSKNSDKILYDPYGVFENGGTTALPRLVLGIYAKLALAILVLFIILILTVFKDLDMYKKIRIIAIPFAYIFSTFCIKGVSLSSSYPTRDFIYILSTMIAIYLFIFSITLFFERKEKFKII